MNGCAMLRMVGCCLMVGGLWHDTAWGEEKNLLVNGSFESGTAVDVIDAWVGEGDHEFREKASVFGYTLGEGTIPDGTYAIKLFSGAANIVQAHIPVRGSIPYAVSGMFYHSSKEDVIDTTAGSLRAFLRVEWFDGNRKLVREDFTPNHNGTQPADQWLPLEATFIAPSNAVTATVHVQTDIDAGGGSIFGDKMYFGEK